MIRIVSNGFYPGEGTQVLNDDGTPIKCVKRIEIMPIDATEGDSAVTAILHVYAELDIRAEPIIILPKPDNAPPTDSEIAKLKEIWREYDDAHPFQKLKLDLRRRWQAFRKWIAF